jgi:hypothetical protein
MGHCGEQNPALGPILRESSQIFTLRLYFAQWPILHNLIRHRGPERITQLAAVAQSAAGGTVADII